MYSINYSHAGAAKVWYCVPAAAADDLETTAAETVYRDPCTTMIEEQGASLQACNEAVAEALAGKTTSMSPRYLVEKGIPVYRAVQEAGSYVVTFPRSYHSGFSTGFNFGEAVNFVLSEWWPFGEHACRLYRNFNRPQIISHEQVLCDEASDLAAKLEKSPGKMELARDERPIAGAFVGMMQRLHHLRENFQKKKIVQVVTCSPDTAPNAAEMRHSVPCKRCAYQCYLVSAVVDGRKPQDDWEHVCLECATSVFADGGGGGEDAGASVGSDGGVSGRLMVYVKPLWSTMENRARIFASLLAKQEENSTDQGSSETGAAAVGAQQQQTLSLAGCSKSVLENLETVSNYTWTELDEPLGYAPSWVAKQSEVRAAFGVDGVIGGGGEEKPLKIRKRSYKDDDDDESWNSRMQEGEEEEGEDIQGGGTSAGTAVAHRKKENGTFQYNAKKSTAPTYTVSLLRTDSLNIPGRKSQIARKIYKIPDTGELAICGADVVQAVSPNHAKSGSLSRCLGLKFYTATQGDRSAPDRYLIYILTEKKRNRSPAITEKAARLLVNSEEMKKMDDYSALCAILDGVWDTLYSSNGDGGKEEKLEGVPAPSSSPPPKRQKVAKFPNQPASAGAVIQSRSESKVFLQNAEPLASLLPRLPPPQRHHHRRQHHPGDDTNNTSGDFKQRAAEIIMEETNKGKKGYVFNLQGSGNGNGTSTALPLKEAPGSTAQMRKYYLNHPSSTPNTNDSSITTSEVVVAASHLVSKLIPKAMRVATMLARWVKGVASCPRATKEHVLCLAPLLCNCENWKNPVTYVLTLEQCAVVYAFGIEEGLYKYEGTAEKRMKQLNAIMVSLWGKKDVVDMIKKVKSVEFVSSTPLVPELKKKLFESGEDGGDADGEEGNQGDAVVVKEDGVAIEEEEPTPAVANTPFSASLATTEKEETTLSEAETGREETVNKKSFTGFPSLFKATDTSSLPLDSQQQVSGLNMEFSAVADPEEVDVAIEAENNRNCSGTDGDGGGGGGSGGGDGGGEKALSGSTGNRAPTLMDELPPLEDDILDLMEAEVTGTVAMDATAAEAAPQQMPPSPPPPPSQPVAEQHFVAQPQHMHQYNPYTSLDPIYIAEPQQQQHQQQQYQRDFLLQQLVEQQRQQHQLMVNSGDVPPVFSLQNRQVHLSGNNWNGYTTPTDDRPPNIVPLYVAPQQQQQQPQQQQQAPPVSGDAGSGRGNRMPTGWDYPAQRW